MFKRFGRQTYALSVPKTPTRAIARWHKVNKKKPTETDCHVVIGPVWERSDNPPPAGSTKCFFCFPTVSLAPVPKKAPGKHRKTKVG